MRILLVSNHLTSLGNFQESINDGYISKDSIISCMSASRALDIISNCGIDTVISYIDLSFYGEGVKLLMGIKKKNPDIHTLLIVKPEDFNKLDPEMIVYIDDYITSPFNKSELRARLTKALINADQREAAAGLKEDRKRVEDTDRVDKYDHDGRIGIDAGGVNRPDHDERISGVNRVIAIDSFDDFDNIEGIRGVYRADQPANDGARPANDTARSINNAVQSVNDIDTDNLNAAGTSTNGIPNISNEFPVAGAVKDNDPGSVESIDLPLRRTKRSRNEIIYRKSRKNERKGPGGAARVVGQSFVIFLLLLLSFIALFLLQSSIGNRTPSIFGNQMYVVISGSMRPTFDAGSLVLVREVDPRSVSVGDIITFKGPDGGRILTTHRVVKIDGGEQLAFTTRGDANNVDDPNPVPAENVVGRVRVYIPYIGYLISFSQTRMGLVFMVFIPGGLLIAYELYNIYTYTGKRKGRREQDYTNEKGSRYDPENGMSGYA